MIITRKKIDTAMLAILTAAGIEEWWDTPIAKFEYLTPNQMFEAGRRDELWNRVMEYRDNTFS